MRVPTTAYIIIVPVFEKKSLQIGSASTDQQEDLVVPVVHCVTCLQTEFISKQNTKKRKEEGERKDCLKDNWWQQDKVECFWRELKDESIVLVELQHPADESNDETDQQTKEHPLQDSLARLVRFHFATDWWSSGKRFFTWKDSVDSRGLDSKCDKDRKDHNRHQNAKVQCRVEVQVFSCCCEMTQSRDLRRLNQFFTFCCLFWV